MTLKIVFDDSVKMIVDKIISGCLPHDKCNRALVPNLVIELKKAVMTDELYGPHYIIYKALDRINIVNRINKQAGATFSLDQLDSMLQTSLEILVMEPELNLTQYLDETGHPSDLTVEANIQNAMNVLYEDTIGLYKELYEEEIATEDCFMYLEDLKEAILTNLTRQSITILARIIHEGYTEKNKTYLGYKGFKEYSENINIEMDNRFKDYNSSQIKQYSFTSFEKAKEFQELTRDSVRPLMKFGYEPLKNIDISTSDVITIVGDEGVGKTGIMTDLASKALREGLDVLIMTGESALSKIYYTMVSIHLKHLHNIPLSWKEVMNINLHSTDIQAKINHAMKDLADNDSIGTLYLVKEFTYDNFYTEVEAYANGFNEKGGVVFIDHTDRLKSINRKYGTGNQKKDNVDQLYLQAIDISDDYPLAVVMLAHTSADANKMSAKGKDVDNARIGASSSSTSKDSDLVLWLRKDNILNQQGLVKVEVKKVREYDSHVKPFILKRDGVTATFHYSDEYQIKTVDDEELNELY